MTRIAIEYCVPCGFREDALDVQKALLDAFGRDLEYVSLVPDHGGVFVVRADGEVLWDREIHGDGVETDLVVEEVRERV